MQKALWRDTKIYKNSSFQRYANSCRRQTNKYIIIVCSINIAYYVFTTVLKQTISLLKNKIFKIISSVQVPKKIHLTSEVYANAKI